jgi:hypothetical protein
MYDGFTRPSVVYGVAYGDGGSEATETWVGRGVVTADGLSVDRCAPADEWFDAPEAPPETPTLTTFLADLPPTAAVGLDFPFGLPEAVVAEETWEAFLRCLPSWVDGPDDLRRRCERHLGTTGTPTAPDARLRATDAPLSAMSPFAEPIVASTFYGLRDVLRPLVLSDAVRVLPMTSPHPDRPFAIEVYPAGTLVDLDLFVAGYEGGDDEARSIRAGTLESLPDATDHPLEIADGAFEAAVAGRAAFDCVVATIAVYRNSRTASALTVSDPQRLLEGQVFV